MTKFLFTLGFLLLYGPAVAFAQPANNDPARVACPMFAKLCPDGSSVSPAGPDCILPACPGATPYASGSGSGTGQSGSARVINRGNAVGLAKYPDFPLNGASTHLQSAKFIVEHRSALNNQHVTIQGTIVSAILGEQACPTRATSPLMGMPCMQPRVTIADTPDASRDTNYDIQVMLKQGDKTTYVTGQSVTIDGTVIANKYSVTIRKD